MELVGESYARFFETVHGTIGVMADIYTTGDTLELRDLVVYPLQVDLLHVGPADLRSIRRQIEEEVRGLGYRELRMTADRLSGANPGRHVVLRRIL